MLQSLLLSTSSTVYASLFNDVIVSGMSFFLKVSDPELPPMMLLGHSQEVTSVAWCPSDFTKVCCYILNSQSCLLYEILGSLLMKAKV